MCIRGAWPGFGLAGREVVSDEEMAAGPWGGAMTGDEETLAKSRKMKLSIERLLCLDLK